MPRGHKSFEPEFVTIVSLTTVFVGWSLTKYSSKIWNLPHTRTKTLGNNFNNGNEKQTRLGVGLEAIAVEVVKLCRENY